VEFFVISSFHESKIPTVDIEVQVYSKIWKKLKSPCSMREGRFHPPKYRGKVQKIGEETLKGLFSRFLIPTTHLFGLMYSTLAGWLQHMPALPILLLKTSNVHNFWSIGPKNTIFFSCEAYYKMHLHKKIQKI
jgi:hypothetical protein